MMTGIVTAAVVAAILTSGTGAPQQASPPPLAPRATVPSDPTDLGEVVVEGQRARETAARFIETIGAPTTSRRLARWPRTVCVAVANLSTDAAQYLVDRISQVALELGLEAGEPGCSANVLIVATVDASGLPPPLSRNTAAPFARAAAA